MFHVLIDGAVAANLKVGANLAPERDRLEKRIRLHHRQQSLSLAPRIRSVVHVSVAPLPDRPNRRKKGGRACSTPECLSFGAVRARFPKNRRPSSGPPRSTNAEFSRPTGQRDNRTPIRRYMRRSECPQRNRPRMVYSLLANVGADNQTVSNTIPIRDAVGVLPIARTSSRQARTGSPTCR